MELTGAYRIPYDAAPALERLSHDRESAISELWENLYHQGDVDTASYAAVPALVKNGELSLVAASEVARHNEQNDEVPDFLLYGYNSALENAINNIPTDEDQLLGFYAIHASLNGQERLARALDFYSVQELLDGF